MQIRILIFVCSMLVASAQVSGQVKTPPETRNAALRYWQAFAELKDPPPSQALQLEMEKTLSGGTGWDEAKLGGVVAANDIALGIMQRATKLPECDWGVEYSRGPQASIAFVSRAHVLARLNTLRGIRELAQGRPQAAVDTWIAGIHFAQDLTKGGPLIFALTAKSVLVLEMRTIAAEAKQGRLGASQREQLYTVVNALPEDGFDWGLAWEMDEAGTDVFFAQLQHSQEPATLFQRMMGEAPPKGCVPPSAQQLRIYHEFMTGVTSALRQPPSVAAERLLDLQGKKTRVCEAIQQAIPSPEQVNGMRVEMISARSEVLHALESR